MTSQTKAPSGVPIEVGADWFEAEVATSNLPVLLDVWAPWCGLCRMVAPAVDALAAEYAGRVKVAKLNADEAGELVGRLGIRGIPTLLFFRDGREVSRKVGAAALPDLRREVEQLLS
ncbi:MAG: thioredoxin domain-containing protein [Nitrospirota bacterium]|nr:thioredoxin domain-containing protein [Nitrospirota bacterium]